MTDFVYPLHPNKTQPRRWFGIYSVPQSASYTALHFGLQEILNLAQFLLYPNHQLFCIIAWLWKGMHCCSDPTSSMIHECPIHSPVQQATLSITKTCNAQGGSTAVHNVWCIEDWAFQFRILILYWSGTPLCLVCHLIYTEFGFL